MSGRQKEKNDFQLMRLRMYEAFAAYHLYKNLIYSIATDVHGEEKAKTNLQTRKRLTFMFGNIIISLEKTFLLDLWTFFDKTNDSLNYEKLLKQLKLKLQKNPKLSSELELNIKSIISEHAVTKDIVKRLRHNVAHLAQNSVNRNRNEDKEIVLTHQKIEDLFTATQEIFRLLENHYESSTTDWHGAIEDAENQVSVLFRDLELGHNEFVRMIRQGPTSTNRE